MRAYINLEGRLYLVESIGWNLFGDSISHVSFMDEDNNFVTVYNARSAAKGMNKPHADLDEVVLWKQK